MAAKRGRPQTKTPAQKAAEVTLTQLATGLSKSDIAKVDKLAKEKGMKPLTFLATMLKKTEAHIPALVNDIGKLMKLASVKPTGAGRPSKAPKAPKSKKGK